MKENKYDQEDFFKVYSGFPRSVGGLAAAGEWHVLRRMLPDMRGKRVLDIGCGMGWHCAWAARNGARCVLGTDISEKMLARARAMNAYPEIEYRRAAMEDLAFDEGAFDVVISSLTFHYTPEFGVLCRRIYRWLSPGGSLVFSAEHPVFTAEGSQQWLETADGRKVWPVDDYFMEGKRRALFLGSDVTKYHRTVTTYVGDILQSGFTLTGLEEPQPEKRLLESVEGMSDELKRPMMLIIAARKPADGQC